MWGWDQPSQRTPVARETARLRAAALCNVFPARGAWTNRLHGGAPCWSSEFGALGNYLHPTSALQNSRGIEIWQYHPARHQCRFSHSAVCPFCISGVILVPFHCLPPRSHRNPQQWPTQQCGVASPRRPTRPSPTRHPRNPSPSSLSKTRSPRPSQRPASGASKMKTATATGSTACACSPFSSSPRAASAT